MSRFLIASGTMRRKTLPMALRLRPFIALASAARLGLSTAADTSQIKRLDAQLTSSNPRTVFKGLAAPHRLDSAGPVAVSSKGREHAGPVTDQSSTPLNAHHPC